MKTVLTLLWLGCLLGAGTSTMTLSRFSREFREKCFSEKRDNRDIKMGQRLPSGFTLSSFLDKLEILEEKLENNPGEKFRGAVQVAAYILRTMYISDYKFEQLGTYDFNIYAAPLRGIVDEMLANIKSPDVKPQDLLPYDDICFLVLSLAHTVNETAPHQQPQVFTPNGAQPEEQGSLPREVGVVSVTNDLTDALAIGRVLFGLASLYEGVGEKDISEAIKENVNATGRLEPISTTTIGNLIGTSFLAENEVAKELSLRGTWHDAGCRVEYQLPRNVTLTATTAEMLGAVDGYILGKYLSLNTRYKRWKLSTLLRAYYSPSGLRVDSGDRLTFCTRRNLLERYKQQLRDSLRPLMVAAKHKLAVSNPEQSLGLFERAWTAFDNSLNTVSGFNEICSAQFREDEPKCDTPIDLFVVLDTSASTVETAPKALMQSVILETILSPVNFQRGVSNIRVYGSRRSGMLLQEIIPPSGSSSCPGCAARYLHLKNLDPSAVGSESTSEVLNSLNRTLREHKESTRSEHGVPSRVVLYINLEDKGTRGFRGSDSQVVTAANALNYGHPDVKKFAVGYKENLQQLASAFQLIDISNIGTGDQHSLDTLRDNIELKDLHKSICRVPAGLQYEHCSPYGNRDEASAIFEGYVTPETVQYWSYSPWYFSASNYLQVKFTAGTNGHIKVCDVTSRVQNDDRLTGLRCLETNDNFKAVTFNASRPCRSGASACDTLRYAVVGKRHDKVLTESSADMPCEGLCRNPQQIKFSVSHEGMYCAGMLSAVFSPVTLLVTLIATLYSTS